MDKIEFYFGRCFKVFFSLFLNNINKNIILHRHQKTKKKRKHFLFFKSIYKSDVPPYIILNRC